MSTIGYARLTSARVVAQPETSTTSSAPGMKTYIDALTALVPAEVLTLHALILTATTATKDGATKVIDVPTLSVSFWVLIASCVALYVVSRRMTGAWNKWDVARAAIPAIAFVAWTLVQKATAFDAVMPDLIESRRLTIGLFLAAFVTAASLFLADKADMTTGS